MAIPVPRNVMVVGNELAIVWDDGREDYFRLDALRRACPCAMCKGEPDLFGKIYRGPDRPLTPLSVQVVGTPARRIVRAPDRLGRRPQRRDLQLRNAAADGERRRMRAICRGVA